MNDNDGRFVWYELMTTDVPGANAFYSAVVGWGVRDVSAPGMPYGFFTVGDEPVCGLMNFPPAAQAAGARPRWIGYVTVSDVDAAAKRVQHLGGHVLVPPMDVPGISRVSIVTDQHMATVALVKGIKPQQMQPAKQADAGRVGWHELVAADGEKALAFYSTVFGWRKAQAETGPGGTYQAFAVAGETIGGMFTKSASVAESYWLYYFNVPDIDVAVESVKTHGGQIAEGLLEVRGGSFIARCVDPQGAIFALEGRRSHRPVGYFERSGSNERGSGGRWSW